MRRSLVLFLLFIVTLCIPTFRVSTEAPLGIPTVLAPTDPRANLPKAVVVEVVDGDTIFVRYRGNKERIRLIGIDTPEKRENEKLRRDARRYGDSQAHQLEMGIDASKFTQSKAVRGATLTLEFDVEQRDRYGRLLAYAYLPNGQMLNALILHHGYAKLLTVPPNVRYAEKFRALMRDARKEKRGLWAEIDRK
jgi:micrococcal nuclease